MIVYQAENCGRRFEYRSNSHRNYVVPPHLHEYSELAFTKEGMTTVVVEGTTYRVPKGCLIWILPNQIHEYRDETSSLMRCAVFSNDHIPAFFENTQNLYPSCPVFDLNDHVELLEQLDAASPEDTLHLCGILNLICALIRKRGTWQQVETGSPVLLRNVIDCIAHNFRESITLRDIAKRLGYHEKYLSSTLHAATGMNFRTFLASYRINLAKNLLRSTDRPQLRISDVALQCGFSSINSFNRAFREITGTTPSAYRELPKA